jgi:hypothetical protein
MRADTIVIDSTTEGMRPDIVSMRPTYTTLAGTKKDRPPGYSNNYRPLVPPEPLLRVAVALSVEKDRIVTP